MAKLMGVVSVQVNISNGGEVRQIANFAWQHLKAAKTFCDQSFAIEESALGREFGDFFVDIRSYVSATVLSAAAALEALINEFFIAPNCALRPKIDDFEVSFWGEKGVERKPILEKYKLALSMLGVQPMDPNAQYYKDAWALIELRNSLIHYKPTWDPDRQKKIDLVRVLSGRYKLSPFLDSRADFLTMQSMSSGCAVWAVNSVFEFIRVFDAKAHLDQEKMAGIWRLKT